MRIAMINTDYHKREVAELKCVVRMSQGIVHKLKKNVKVITNKITGLRKMKSISSEYKFF